MTITDIIVYRLSGKNLIDFYFGAGLFELLLYVFGFLLVYTFFYRLGGAFYKLLGFLETERGYFPDGLNDLDLVRSRSLEDNVELGLFDLLRRRLAASSAWSRRNRLSGGPQP